jgi:hypothetical protein
MRRGIGLLRRAASLERDDVVSHGLFDTLGLAVHRLQMFHASPPDSI